MLNQFKVFSRGVKPDGFCEYEWSDRVVVRGKQTFAVFGSVSYDVTKMKFNYDETCAAGTGKLCVPVSGRYLAQLPDEGRSGIMGMYIINRKNKNVKSDVAFVPCGWLHTDELSLSNSEIAENIMAGI